jgi:signal transduction histidine kinase
MILGIATIVLLENWDARHQARTALDALARQHELMALSLIPQLGTLEARGPAASSTEAALCATVQAIEQTGPVVVLFRSQGADALRSCRGPAPRVGMLQAAIDGGASRATLDRDEASRLGLRERVAVAGIARASRAPGTILTVVGSAAGERDRGRRQQNRALISTSIVSALIVGLGLTVLRKQRRELALEQRVELERTRQERDTELEKANRMATLAALASGFAHEIGTPLAIIAGRLEQLQTSILTPDRRHELLAKMKVQIDRIDQLLRSFLAFARGDAPMLTKLPVGDLTQNAAKLVRHRFASAGVELRLELGDAGSAQVTCEPALLEQALVNVLINALEASLANQAVTLRLELETQRVAIFISDMGAGIPPSALERVTEPFFTTKAKKGGSGLGLTIVKEIVVHHRGELVVRHRRDGAGAVTGTEVLIRLPYLGDR